MNYSFNSSCLLITPICLYNFKKKQPCEKLLCFFYKSLRQIGYLLFLIFKGYWFKAVSLLPWLSCTPGYQGLGSIQACHPFPHHWAVPLSWELLSGMSRWLFGFLFLLLFSRRSILLIFFINFNIDFYNYFCIYFIIYFFYYKSL